MATHFSPATPVRSIIQPKLNPPKALLSIRVSYGLGCVWKKCQSSTINVCSWSSAASYVTPPGAAAKFSGNPIVVKKQFLQKRGGTVRAATIEEIEAEKSVIEKDAKGRMEKTIESVRSNFNSIRTGRASPAMLDKIEVDYYGSPVGLKSLAQISSPDGTSLLISPYDKSSLKSIEKAIVASDLGMTPNNDGDVIRLTLPQLTSDRRKELTKVVAKQAEEGKVALRNIRRDALKAYEKLQKEKKLSEDTLKDFSSDLQKWTDEYVKKLDTISKQKEKRRTERMKVMDRIGSEARRSSMAAAAGLSGRRDRVSSKRRRGDEESMVSLEEDECKVDVEENMVLSHMSSSSARRRNRTVVRDLKEDQTLMVIGVQVPRKARSASGKRSHENSSSGKDGVGKDQKLQKLSVEPRKKLKQIGVKTSPPKLSKLSSGSAEEDIEIEIAEVLFGLMNQSQSSKDGDSVKTSTSNHTRNDSRTSISEQESSHASDPELKHVSKENNSTVEVESDQQLKMETSMPSWEPKSEGVSGSVELQEDEAQPVVEESVGKEVKELESKREDKFEFDLMAPPPIEDSATDKLVAEAVLETKIEVMKEKLNESTNQDNGTKSQQQPKAIIPKPERADWRSSLTATTMQPGNSTLSQPCAKRCATHHYIARNIYLHLNGTKMNNLWSAAAGSAPQCDTKPDRVVTNPSLGSVSGHSAKESKDQSSEAAFIEESRNNKLVAQRSPTQPASAGNLMHTFELSTGQNQASVAATSNTSGPSKYTKLTNNVSHSSHSALSTVAATNLSSTNVTFQQGPYLAINGYSFPISTPSGTTLAFQGGNSTQTVPLYNGPFYSNQMFHPSQLQQQHPHSQHQLRSLHKKNTGICTDSSLPHRQQESQQPQKRQCSSTQTQQSQKQYVPQALQPCKLESDINGGHTTTSSQAQRNAYACGQNTAVSLQPMNITMMPYLAVSGGGSENHLEKTQRDLKAVFGMSFASVRGHKGTSTLLNFSSMSQNPAIYQTIPATQAAHQKHHHQVSERKTGTVSGNPDHDGSKAVTGRSSSAVVQTLVFDNSATDLNFTTSKSQQQHIYRFQLQQQQPAMAARTKAPKSAHVFSQALAQCTSSVQYPNSGKSSNFPSSQYNRNSRYFSSTTRKSVTRSDSDIFWGKP